MKIFTNYAQFFYSRLIGFVHHPNSLSELSLLIKKAKQENTPIRIIGNSHTLNSSNIPRNNEVIVSLSRLNTIKIIDHSSALVGAGRDLRSLQYYLNSQKLDIPIINGGKASPTLGGFISAGGIGKTEDFNTIGRSELYGGFWQNVIEITYLDGRGKIFTIDTSSDLFLWFFGSLGQFGVVVEAKIKLIPSTTFSTANVIFDSEVFESQSLETSCLDYHANTNRTLWVSVFSQKSQLDQVWDLLYNWVATYSDFVLPVSDARWAGPIYQGRPIGYLYNVSSDSPNPPLVYFYPGNFCVLGIAFSFITGDSLLNSKLSSALQILYSQVIDAGFLLYPSVENICMSYSFDSYYPPLVASKARSIRNMAHCTNFLNIGWLENQINDPDLVSI
jgi:hypothetical protein